MRLIYFSPVPYASYAQRPHFMVRYWLEAGIKMVLWVDPYATRLPEWADMHRRSARKSPITVPFETDICVLPVRAFPVEPLLGGALCNRVLLWRGLCTQLRAFANGGGCLVGVGRPSALALWALRRVSHAASFFDAMDDFPAFYKGLSARAMASREWQIADAVNRVICSSHSLLKKFTVRGIKAELRLNGYAMSQLPEPLPSRDRTLIGYVGTIGKWFDWRLVIEIAQALPDMRIRLIGPEFVPRPGALPKNIEIMPECSQAQAVLLVREFIAGLIPFNRSHLTDGVDPIKYYEYRALGVPVWSTVFGEMERRVGTPGTYAISHGANWRELVTITRAFSVSPADVRAFRIAHDWSARFSDLAPQLFSHASSQDAQK